MKNKKLTYFLIAIVIGLWGVIIYQVISRYTTKDGEDDITAPSKTVKEAYDDYSMPKDTSRLLLNYRDPFGISKQKDTLKRSYKIQSKIDERQAQPKQTINWSFITYSGYIRNPSSKKLVALVSINGQNLTMTEGETKSQVRLLKNLRDSIKISYAGKVKFIPLKLSL